MMVAEAKLHRLLWTGEEYHHSYTEIDQLLGILDRNQLELLSLGIIFHHKINARSVTDLAPVIPAVIAEMLMCEISQEVDSDSIGSFPNAGIPGFKLT